MQTNQKENNIKSLIKDFSIETTPNVYSKYGNFSEFLHQKNDVYVTYLPDEKSERVINTAKKLNKLFTVWGHFFFNKPNMLF